MKASADFQSRMAADIIGIADEVVSRQELETEKTARITQVNDLQGQVNDLEKQVNDLQAKVDNANQTYQERLTALEQSINASVPAAKASQI